MIRLFTRSTVEPYVVTSKPSSKTSGGIDFTDAPSHETVDKGHGRIKRRRCAVKDLSGPEWDGYANLHGRRQALCIQRERHILKTGRRSVEVSYSPTSLGPNRAGPEELLSLARYSRNRHSLVVDI